MGGRPRLPVRGRGQTQAPGTSCVYIARASEYVQTILDTPEAHMDMMEGVPVTHLESLTAGRFAIMPVEWPEGMAEVAVANDIDYLEAIS